MHYDRLVGDALRGVLRTILERAARPGGFPEPHHVFISFRTTYPGVTLPKTLVEQFPEEMTIVIKAHYWDLEVKHDRFEVTMSFSGQKERLTVPYAAVTQISDPTVPFGLRFEVPEPSPEPPQEPPEEDPEGDNVVSLFKKR